MTTREIAPYGSWISPITSDVIVSGEVALGEIELDGADIYWTEVRPSEAGRTVIVHRRANGGTEDVTPAGFNVRTRVHEYGGGAYVVDRGTVFFSNFDDNRVYRQDVGGNPRPITPEAPLRYADAQIDSARNRLICIREDHSDTGREAVNTLVAVDLDGDAEQQVLVSGADFYSSPRLSPDGSCLTWLAWNHPNMPWDECELWVGAIAEDGSIVDAGCVAGGQDVSIFQPQWAPDGILHYVSDRSGWWNLYRWRDDREEPLHEMEAEFGVPYWVFGLSRYAFIDSSHIVCIYRQHGADRLALLDIDAKSLQPVEVPFQAMDSLRATPEYAVLIGGSPRRAPAVIRLDLASVETEILRASTQVSIDDGYISIPEAVEFPTEDGLTAYGFFYAPTNRDYSGPDGELPPLIVRSHGGPTGATTSTLRLQTLYWTSRGFAVLDVNYGGSSGYGRSYRERLDGQWGVVDVDDCVNGALYLANQGKVDRERLTIVGGSAGGYTALCALTMRTTFKAGASYFGLADLEPFISDTHKFESRYLDRLIGPYPQQRDLYRQRSPIHHTDGLAVPVILFQGLDDKIVPPNQAEIMVDALRKKGLPFAYVTFEGEGHGFRRAENIKRMLDGELYFYSRIFGFNLQEDVEPLEIENLREPTASVTTS